MITTRQNALYWNTWRQLCLGKGWPQADSSLRHHLHRHALGYDKSHANLTNAEYDRVLAQFRLALNPDDLRAALVLTDPDRGQRKRTEYSIRQFPFALVAKVARDKFGRGNLADLNVRELQRLLMTLKRMAREARAEAQIVREALELPSAADPF